MIEKIELENICRRLKVRLIKEENSVFYFEAEQPSVELRDDLKDLLDREVQLIDKKVNENTKARFLGGVEETFDAVQLSESILRDAVKECCSDVHIEPADDYWRVRMRRDGTLFLYDTYPKHTYSELITRFKILAAMDIGERRRPQDGRFTYKHKEKQIDIRASSIPVKGEEKLVLRLLDRSGLDYTPAGIGLRGKNLELVEKLLRQPLGLILICGPTGSGKTSTLYTFVQLLNKVEKNILTIEDPVEFSIEGINQMQVNTKANITFTSGLEAMLRQDPEVMMVGEIRSKETADIALRSSITGYLIFSTLHTTDSPSAVIRLIDMGIEPYMISAGVIGIISQRLVRKLCPECKEPIYSEDVFFNISGRTYQSVGCSSCRGGYVGREAIYEILLLDDEMRTLIRPGVTLEALRKQAVKSGMISLKEALRAKIIEGSISLEEAYQTMMTM